MRLILIILILVLSSCASISPYRSVYIENKKTIKIKSKKHTTVKPPIKKAVFQKSRIGITYTFPAYSAKRIYLWNPVPNYTRVSSPFGWRKKEFHRGVDLAAPIGSRVIAANDGTIIAAGRHKFLWGYGNTILISHGDDIFTYYCHLSKVFVKKGQNVEQGQLIGCVGNSGRSKGPHLHLELIIDKKLHDPIKFFVERPLLNRFKEFAGSIKLGAGLRRLIYVLSNQG